jgi:hypothetical protein
MSDLIRSHTEPQLDSRASRRSFLKLAGIGGVVLVAAGCDSDTPDPIVPGDFGNVTGTVTDSETGEGVADVLISFDDDDIPRTVMTQEDGSFTIEDFPVGTFTLVASTNGFESDMTEITVTDGGTTTAAFVIAPGGPLELSFAGRNGVLNYAYALEQLEAAFYAAVVADPAFGTIFNADEQDVINDLLAHEVAHREFFREKILEQGGVPIRGLRPDFSAVELGNKTSVLETARTFEDLGVAAYNGAALLINQVDPLVNAGEIVSVEARHAAAIRDILNPNDFAFDELFDEDNAEFAIERSLTPTAVLAAAAPFIQNEITPTGL